MSWDVYFQDWGEYESLNEIPDNFISKGIGKKGEIIKKIIAIIPDVNFEDRNWGVLKRENFSIEFNMGDKEILKSFTLHIRGNEESEEIVFNLIEKLNIRASDGIKIFEAKK